MQIRPDTRRDGFHEWPVPFAPRLVTRLYTLDPAASRNLHGLDHLRALAIALVFLSHYVLLNQQYPAWIKSLAQFGWSGVDLFFVLSGYLIAAQLFRQMTSEGGISLRQFFLKRFFRILPAFWVTLVLYYNVPFLRERESLPPLWKFLTFTQNLGLDLRFHRTFSHAWSLCVEEHFYLVLPLTLLLLHRLRLWRKAYWLLLTLFFLGFFARWLSHQELYLPDSDRPSAWTYWYRFVYYPTWNRLDGLLIGVSLAALQHYRPDAWARLTRRGLPTLLLGLALLVGAYFLCEQQMTLEATVLGFPLVSLGYGGLVLAALSPTCFLARWRSRVTTQVAILSYAVYLTHKCGIHITPKLFGGWVSDVHLLFLLAIGVCAAMAALLHWLVERPFLRWRDRILQRAPGA